MWKKYQLPLFIALGVVILVAGTYYYNATLTFETSESQASLIDKMTREELLTLIIRKKQLTFAEAAELDESSDEQLKQELKKIS